jgi:regulator of RNase E activity RraA
MRPTKAVSPQLFTQLEKFDSCTISNAIETFRVRTRNEGFMNSSVRCMFPELGPRAGYVVTARIRSSSTPIAGRCYYDRPDWWTYVQSIPGPKFVAIQDVDHVPGLGALIGEIHANIFIALGCTALVTNGAVRDLPGVQDSGLQVFAGNVSVSHSYAHVVDYGAPIEIAGLTINPGDLFHGDRHGVVCIPFEIAEELPAEAARIVENERELIGYCRSPQFSADGLTARIQHVSEQLDGNAAKR